MPHERDMCWDEGSLRGTTRLKTQPGQRFHLCLLGNGSSRRGLADDAEGREQTMSAAALAANGRLSESAGQGLHSFPGSRHVPRMKVL